MDLIDNYRTFHMTAAEYTLFSMHSEHSPGSCDRTQNKS